MTLVTSFTVPGKPVPQGGMTAFAKGNRAFVTHKRPKDLGNWRAKLELAAADAEMVDGPVEVRAEFRLPRPKGHFGTGRNASVLKPSAPAHPTTKPDIDKLTRSLFDALTNVVVRDDSQIVSKRISKSYALGAPETYVEVWSLA